MPVIARRDLYTSLVFIAFGVGVVVESLRMPRFENLGVNSYTVPGIVPGVVGATIALLAGVMLLRSLRRLQPGGDLESGPLAEGSTRRLLLTLTVTLAYGGLLVGLLPFWLATFLFVTTFIVLFEWRGGQARGRLGRTVAVALLEGVLVAAAVTFVFERIFLVRLP